MISKKEYERRTDMVQDLCSEINKTMEKAYKKVDSLEDKIQEIMLVDMNRRANCLFKKTNKTI